MKLHPMICPPAGYELVSCVAGYGGYPHDAEILLREVGLEAALSWGDALSAALVSVYLTAGKLVPLWIIVNISTDAKPGQAVALTINPETGGWHQTDLPPAFEPLVSRAQEYEVLDQKPVQHMAVIDYVVLHTGTDDHKLSIV